VVADLLTLEAYRQPPFYRFNQDSIRLVDFVDQSENKTSLKFLDIGSGCGVIGIELSLKNPDWFGTLLEAQVGFIEYIESNISLKGLSKLNVVHKEIEDFKEKELFDLVVFNPPYFIKGRGRESEDEQRQKCRHISQEDLNAWFLHASKLLSEQGGIYFCFQGEALKELDFLDFDLRIVEVKELGKLKLYKLKKN